MKIALIHSHLNDRGGSQRYVIEIAKNLKLLGVEVDVFAYEYNENACYPELTKGLDISYLYTIESCYDNRVKRTKNELKSILKQIYTINIVKKTYLFSWEEVPGNDSVKLIEFLMQNFNIGWIEAAKISKNDDGKTIRITNDTNFLSLALNNEKNTVNIEIDDGRTDKFIVKMENGELNIYKKTIIELGLDYIYSMGKTFSIAKKIANLINKKSISKKYDLVFAHEEPLSVWAAIEYKKISNTPIYWFCYDTIEKWFLEWREEHKKSKLRSFLLRNLFFKYDQNIIYKYVDKIAVLDNNMSKRVERLYGVKPIIRRGGIPENLLSYDRNNFIRTKIVIDDSKIVVFSLTRFIAYRRVHDIFELYRKIPEHIKDKLFFYINAPITDENYYKMCKRKYSDIFNNPNFVVETSYFQDDTEMYNTYLSSDIFIFPNQNQTWGHAPLEAMACGCLAVVSDGCGIHEVIENITPTVYEVGKIEMLKELFVSLIEKGNCKELAHKQKAYVSKNLTWNKVCEQYISDFNDILMLRQVVNDKNDYQT